jgi:hypothetical protein
MPQDEDLETPRSIKNAPGWSIDLSGLWVCKPGAGNFAAGYLMIEDIAVQYRRPS